MAAAAPAPTALHTEVLAANAAYAAAFGAKGALAMPPARRAAFVVCMDARLDVAKFAGLSEGDAHVIRNAGGRADDSAIRSLVISHKLLATNEWCVDARAAHAQARAQAEARAQETGAGAGAHAHACTQARAHTSEREGVRALCY